MPQDSLPYLLPRDLTRSEAQVLQRLGIHLGPCRGVMT